MKVIIAFSLTCVLLLFSCKSEKNKALAYNDQIVIFQVQLITGLEKLYDQIQAKQVDSATMQYNTLKVNVKTWLQEVQKVEPVAGGEVMKEKVTDLLTFYDDLFAQDFAEYFKILNSPQPDSLELQSLYTKIQFMELMAVQLERELGEAQDSFITQYGVSVKRPPNDVEDEAATDSLLAK